MNILRLKLLGLRWITLLLLLSNGSVIANKLEVLIAVPIGGRYMKTVKQSLMQAQEVVKKEADGNGYELDTSFAAPERMHLTLEFVSDVPKASIPKYIKCIRRIAATTEAFDITESVSKAYFNLFGWGHNWAVLRFPTPKKSPLNFLVRNIKSCIERSGLKKGMFPGFKAHLSLGKFIKTNGKPLPTADNLAWVPKIDFTLPEQSFVVDRIVFTVREKIENKKAGTVTYKEYPDEFFRLKPLQSNEAVAATASVTPEAEVKKMAHEGPMREVPDVCDEESEEVPAAEAKGAKATYKSVKKIAAPATWVVKTDSPSLFSPSATLQLAQKGTLQRSQNRFPQLDLLLREEALKSPEVNSENAEELSQELRYVRGVFNEQLLNQQPSDPPFKLSARNSILFSALPESLQQEILAGRRIEFAAP